MVTKLIVWIEWWPACLCAVAIFRHAYTHARGYWTWCEGARIVDSPIDLMVYVGRWVSTGKRCHLRV